MSEELIDRLERLAAALVQELDSLKKENSEWRQKCEQEASARQKAEESNQGMKNDLSQLNRLRRESEKWAEEKQKIRGKAKNLLKKIDSADFI